MYFPSFLSVLIGMTEILDPREQAAKEYHFKQEINRRVRAMLDAGISTAHVAEILGAEDFLQSSKKGTIFRVADFIDAEIAAGMKLLLPDKVVKRDKPSLPPGTGKIETGSG
jgi:hypothetical protein